MKWGQASRRQKKPWQTGGNNDEASPVSAVADKGSPTAATGATGASKPWLSDKQKPSVAKILNALSFEDDNDDDRNNWESLEKSQASLAMTEDPTETESTLEHIIENGDCKASGETAKEGDDDDEEVLTEASTAVQMLPEETSKAEDQQQQQQQPTVEVSSSAAADQHLSPAGSVYYNAKESEEDEPTPTKDTEMPLLELKNSTETAPDAQQEHPDISQSFTPESPVQSGVRYFSEELRLKKQLSSSSSKSFLDATILPEGAVKQKVETVELTEAQIACKRLAHAAAAAAQRRIAERERQAVLQLPLRQEPTSPSATALATAVDSNVSSPSSRADQLQSELEKGRQRALEALARAKQQKEEQEEQQQQEEQQKEPAAGSDSAREIRVRSTSLVSGDIPISRSEDEAENDDENDDERNETPPHKFYGDTSDNSPRRTRIAEIVRSELCDKDDTVVQAALQHLAEEADADPNCSAAIAEQGGILAVVRAMEQHTDSANIQIAACNAFEKLALNTETELAIGQVGGVEAILSAMAAHSSHPSVQEAAWSALWNCTCGNACDVMTGIDAQDGLAALVSCMQEHLGSADVQANACGALTNLCVAHEKRLEALVQAGGVVAVATALQRHWRNERVRREASLCMTLLLGGQATHVDDEDEGSCSVIDEVVILEEEELMDVEEEEVVDHDEEAYDEQELEEEEEEEEEEVVEEEILKEHSDEDESIEVVASEDE